jgi:hypothetical protein
MPLSSSGESTCCLYRRRARCSATSCSVCSGSASEFDLEGLW